MNIIVKDVNLGGGGWDGIASDLLVISLFEGQSAKEAGLGTLDAALGGLIEQVIETGDFKGEALKTRLLYTHGDAVATRRILLVGLGKQAEFTTTLARRAAGVAAQTLVDLKRGAFAKRAIKKGCLLYTSPSPRDRTRSRMPSSA